MRKPFSPKLLHQLLLDELADLALYRALRPRATGELADVLDGFIQTEIRHVAFWRQRTGSTDEYPGLQGRLRNALLQAAIFLFGSSSAFLVLEAVEVHGVRKYLRLWERVKDKDIQSGLETILQDELQHEDEAVMGGRGRRISPETVRNAFLGFNDGSVEILGAVSGFAAAFAATPSLVVISGLTVSVAGSISMAAGAFLSTHSEHEMKELEEGKQRFLERNPAVPEDMVAHRSPWRAARLVGISYLIGAAVPVLPFVFGAHQPYWSILFSGILILAVSGVLAFLSGMGMLKRVLLNLGVLFAAVGISYAVGLGAHALFGV